MMDTATNTTIDNLPAKLESLYHWYTKREFVHPDPLEFLYGYDDPQDREIVGLVASSLAYGRVWQILKSVAKVLAVMPSPRRYLQDSSVSRIYDDMSGFKHRFTTDSEIAQLLVAMKKAIGEHGSLERLFVMGMKEGDRNTIPALTAFTGELSRAWNESRNSLIPDVSSGSACKRLHLYLKWMVRRDDVDIGDWAGVDPAMLIYPMDVHMHRIAGLLGMTRRKSADIRTALEVTDCFRKISHDDPVKYDFALTRLGIRDVLDVAKVFDHMRRCNTPCLTL